MIETKNVLCVLSEEQYGEYAIEFGRLAQAGVNLILESSPEVAITNAPSFSPRLIIVGMDLGLMEGLEFMAYLLNRHKDLDIPIVLLPDKKDDLRPVLHARDQSSGNSSVIEVNFDMIEALLDELPMSDVPVEIELPTVEPVPDPPDQDLETPAQKNRLPIMLGAAAVVAVLVVVGYLVFGGGDPASQATPGDGETTPSKAVGDKAPPSDHQAAGSPTPVGTDQQPAMAQSAPPFKDEEVVLPLTFKRGSSIPSISEADELDQIVAAVIKSDSKIGITGYTSADGEVVENLQLGIQRARSAMSILVKHGVNPERFEITSRGERAPAASNETENGRRQNRRVTIMYHPAQ